MVETTTQTSKPHINIQLSPLKAFEKAYCQHCADREYCNANPKIKLLCVLSTLTSEIQQIRQNLESKNLLEG
mgnify:CR=1 FL=1